LGRFFHKQLVFALAGDNVAGNAVVGQPAAAVGFSHSALSRHLSLLRESGIVSYRRESQTLRYTIVDPQVSQILATLWDIYCRPDDNKES